jgi:exodeoxyribonuclease VII large subunit
MRCLRVSQLNELAREALKACFGDEVWVQGEIHGLKVHAKSGHIYFDLVEKQSGSGEGYLARISCAFFRGSFVAWKAGLRSIGMQGFELASGIEVKLKARVDLFAREGRYQLIVSEIDPAYTFGAMARKREQTIEALRAEGLLERNKALPFPEIPRQVGIITSEGSAALNDFVSILSESGYAFTVSLFDAHMQGENTVREVVSGIEVLERHPGVELIVIIRGGGARTDLLPFDDLALCRAVAQCSKPVVTGIGHEIDVSVADLVAHTCCVTPTDAARMLVSRMDEVWAFLERMGRDLFHRGREHLQRAEERLRLRAAGLGHLTRGRIVSESSVLKDFVFYLHTALTRGLSGRERALAALAAGLLNSFRAAVHRRIEALEALPRSITRAAEPAFALHAARLGSLSRDLCGSARESLARGSDSLEHLESLFSAMDPSAVLKRGFSITTDSAGRVITDAAGIGLGESITTRLSRGRIASTVTDKEP